VFDSQPRAEDSFRRPSPPARKGTLGGRSKKRKTLFSRFQEQNRHEALALEKGLHYKHYPRTQKGSLRRACRSASDENEGGHSLSLHHGLPSRTRTPRAQPTPRLRKTHGKEEYIRLFKWSLGGEKMWGKGPAVANYRWGVPRRRVLQAQPAGKIRGGLGRGAGVDLHNVTRP